MMRRLNYWWGGAGKLWGLRSKLCWGLLFDTAVVITALSAWVTNTSSRPGNDMSCIHIPMILHTTAVKYVSPPYGDSPIRVVTPPMDG